MPQEPDLLECVVVVTPQKFVNALAAELDASGWPWSVDHAVMMDDDNSDKAFARALFLVCDPDIRPDTRKREIRRYCRDFHLVCPANARLASAEQMVMFA